MLNKRCSKLLYEIMNADGYISILQLSKVFGVSNRTIRYDLDRIDDFLESSNLPQLIRKPNEGIAYECSEVEKSKVLDLLGEIDLNQYVLSQDERITMILTELLESRNYITMERLAEIILVSRSTIIKDMEKVKQWLINRNLELKACKNHGVRIIGEEKYLRKAALVLLTDNVDVYKALSLIKASKISKSEYGLDKYKKQFFKDIDLSYIENCLHIAEKQLETKFTDEAYSGLVIHIAIAIKRIKENKDIVMEENELKALEITNEFVVASSIAKILENRFQVVIPIDEIGYMAIHLLGSNVSISNNNDVDWGSIEFITNNFINNVGSILGVDLFDDKQLFDGLIQHIRPTIYRLKHDLTLKNPLLREIKESYEKVFCAIKGSNFGIEEYAGNKLSDEEIGYLTLHFAAAIERKKGTNKKIVNVIVVCATGIGTSKLVSSKIQSLFNINIIDTIAYHHVDDVLKNGNVDLIITTVPIKSDTNNIPCIEVNPFLTEKNINDISTALRKYNGGYASKRNVSLEKIIQIIGHSCTILNSETLSQELASYLSIANDIKKGVFEPMLDDLLTNKFIRLNVDAENWEQAVRVGGEILKNNDVIEQKYIEGMINSVKTLGPYIVIAPGIAMPHARPDESVKKIGMSLITLNKPINFGNKDNDPVTIVVCLCAVDHSSHLKALSELVTFLGDEKFITIVSNAKDSSEIINYIKNKGDM
ncbi:BglG family transcription antiterminator [Clostridium akagii]|uniref:BglG family transcription antiterminator n=1 Tax=Clostridium akagii TaxID=91623 RepID=UPI00047DFEAF|nr:BglG family transcription antiterminator [Clostridium akagii]